MLQKGSFLSVRNLLLNLEAESQGQSPRDLVQVAAHQRWCLLQDSMWERGQRAPSGSFLRALTIHEGVLLIMT